MHGKDCKSVREVIYSIRVSGQTSGEEYDYTFLSLHRCFSHLTQHKRFLKHPVPLLKERKLCSQAVLRPAKLPASKTASELQSTAVTSILPFGLQLRRTGLPECQRGLLVCLSSAAAATATADADVSRAIDDAMKRRWR